MKEVLIFDLDGTLTESDTGIINAVLYVLEKFHIEDKNREDLLCFIGPPFRWSFQHFLGFTEEQAVEAEEMGFEYYSTKGMFENRVYDGVTEVLAELKKKGYSLMVATAKPEYFTIPILEKFELNQYFDFVAGASAKDGRENKAEIIQYLLEENQLTDSTKILMVGDRYHDVEGAHKFGIECAGVLYGYGDREELEEAGTDYILEELKDLLDILK